MNEKKRSIGNEQALPVNIINESIIEYLETKDLNKESLFLKVKETYNGDNRAKKATNAIYSVITRKSCVSKALINTFNPETFYNLNDADKNTVIMSLICLRFPFTFDLIHALAKLFYVQDTVNKQYIMEKMISLYGSNLSLEHGVAAAMSIAIDCGFIKREKPGLFSKPKPNQKNSFSKEAWVSTFFELNGKKSFTVNDLYYEPVISYLSDLEIDWNNTKILETATDFSNQLIISKLK